VLLRRMEKAITTTRFVAAINGCLKIALNFPLQEHNGASVFADPYLESIRVGSSKCHISKKQ
jgi:hypothetical protein